MKLAVLTTQTLHHTYFLKEIAHACSDLSVILETKYPKYPFDVHHSFEKDREEYERHLWFDGQSPLISQCFSTRECWTVNDHSIIRQLEEWSPTLVIVFGTGLIKSSLLSTINADVLNLHGGDPETYRGLDSHLWSIYHDNFDCLKTTLHRVTDEIDAGEIVSQAIIPLYRNMSLKQLRAANSEICVDLVVDAMQFLDKHRKLPRRKQIRKGRYYSAMPTSLKDVCLKKFDAHTSALVT